MKKQIGILGGMGPEVTSELFSMIIKNTETKNDQDHIPVLIYNNPKIPDRSSFIFGKGPSPVNMLIESALKLEKMGADFILIPCNTAHFFTKKVEEKIRIPIIDMIKQTVDYVQSEYPRIKKYGLISTTGTYKTDIYKLAFNNAGLTIIYPEKKWQDDIMEAIYGKEGIKAGFRTDPLKKLLRYVARLEENGADAVISGCTEISLVLKQSHLNMPLIDPLQILALRAVQLAGYSLLK